MSETPNETPNETPQAQTPNFVSDLKATVGNFLGSWKVKLGLGVAALVGLLVTVFFWQHLVAGMGMNLWSSKSGASPIECMVRDTNGDRYVSCSAMLRGEVVPLECGASVFNIGCRVNYGAAAPTVRERSRPSL